MASYNVTQTQPISKAQYTTKKPVALSSALQKKKWKKRKTKESQATRTRKKSQFSLSDQAKAKLASLAKNTAAGNMSQTVERLILGNK